MKKEHVSWEKFEEGCKELVKQIKKDKFEPDVIFTIPRGGFPIATRIAHLLDIDTIETDKERANRRYMRVLFIDDIADSGRTILENFPQVVFKCKVATLYYKETSKVKPDFFAFTTDKWVVFPWEEK